MNARDDAVSSLLAQKYRLQRMTYQLSYEVDALADALARLMRAMECGRPVDQWTDEERHAFIDARAALRGDYIERVEIN